MSVATYRGVKYNTDAVKERRHFQAQEVYRGLQLTRQVEVRK